MSGIAASVWVHSLPSDWDSARIRWLFRIINGGTPATSEASCWGGEIPWATPEDLGRYDGAGIRKSRRTLTDAGVSASSAEVVPAGSLLLSTRAPIGYVSLAQTPFTTNQGCRALVPISSDINPRYYLYSLVAARGLLQAEGQGSTFTELSSSDLGDVRLPFPPRSAQDAIAAFLDRETARINILIEKKRRLLDLLEEKRTALITRAVTRGLDPEVPMKGSGVEWIGKIPEHWSILPLKRLWVRSDYGISDSGREGGRYPVLTMGDIHRGTVTVPDARGVDDVDPALLLEPGDLLFNRTNSRSLVGKVGLYNGEAEAITFASYLVRLRPRQSVSARFLVYLLNSTPVLAEARARSLLSINQANLNPTRYGEIAVPRPPRDEQDEIAAVLCEQESHLDSLRKRIADAIFLLQEYRTAVISAAVTGKLSRVRDL